eukprot:155340-Chlamydomonas_euryale.AAC.7
MMLFRPPVLWRNVDDVGRPAGWEPWVFEAYGWIFSIGPASELQLYLCGEATQIKLKQSQFSAVGAQDGYRRIIRGWPGRRRTGMGGRRPLAAALVVRSCWSTRGHDGQNHSQSCSNCGCDGEATDDCVRREMTGAYTRARYAPHDRSGDGFA